MNSDSKPDLTGGKSRRAFIHKIGTAAAVSSLPASVSAAQQPPPPRRAPETWPEPGPLSKQPMPTIRLGKHQVGRLILGINSIGSHFSAVLARTYREWNTPQQQVQIYKHCEELGINLRIQTRDQIVKYNAEYGGKMLFSSQGSYSRFPTGEVRDPTKLIKDMAAVGPIAIHYSAAGADEI